MHGATICNIRNVLFMLNPMNFTRGHSYKLGQVKEFCKLDVSKYFLPLVSKMFGAI